MAEVCQNRREHGSFFHIISHPNEAHNPQPWDKDGLFFGSGRDALRCLLTFGLMTRGWKRLLIPSYFCQAVVSSIVSTGIEVVLYSDAPGELPQIDADPKPGDVLFRMNYFGLRSSFPMNWADQVGVEVIDDHTHDPWSDWAWNSDADWCIASFRKALPLPDGGVLWSPQGHALPDQPEVTEERRAASLEKLAAMTLRGLYLEGHSIQKDLFRQLSISAETRIGNGDVSGMPEWTYALLGQFPTTKWREQRRRNHQLLSAALADIPELTVLMPEDDKKSCPFAGTLIFGSPEMREYVRQQLISHDVYLPVMWELDNPAIEGISSEHITLSRCIASVPCDMRYDARDIERVAGLIGELCTAYKINS